MKKHAVLVSERGLPTVISQDNPYYPDFIRNGYQQVYAGSKAECEEHAQEITESFADDLFTLENLEG